MEFNWQKVVLGQLQYVYTDKEKLPNTKKQIYKTIWKTSCRVSSHGQIQNNEQNCQSNKIIVCKKEENEQGKNEII